MRLLLDTHTCIWFIDGNPALSPTARALIEDETHTKFLSIASVWEMAIKMSLGKLSLGVALPDYVATQVDGNGISLLPIEASHAFEVVTLPLHHRDPFDRLLVAQSLHEGMPLISADAVLDPYGIQRLW